MCKNGKTGVPFLALDWKTGNHFLKFSTTLRDFFMIKKIRKVELMFLFDVDFEFQKEKKRF